MLKMNRQDMWVAAALAAILLLAHAITQTALTGPFIFDDYPNLSNLSKFAGGFDLKHFALYLEGFPGDPGRPLAALSFMIEDQAWPSDPAPFKRTNLLLHLLNGLLVFGLVRCLARPRLTQRAGAVAGLLAAAAWLLHPMQLSTTMLVVQRMTILMTMVSLAATWWAAHYLQRASLTLSRSLWLLFVTAFATVTAYLCKENGALLPLYIAVIAVTLLRPAFQSGDLQARRLLLVGLAIPILAILAYLAATVVRYVPDGLRDFTPIERLMTQSRVIADYLARLAVPQMRGSGLFHDDFLVSRSLFDPLSTLFASAFCVALIAGAFVLRARAPRFAFAVLWYFGGHLLESTTYPLELYFEHRNYLPMVGPIVALALWLCGLPHSKLRKIYWAAALAWLVICAGMTAIQSQIWGSEPLLAGVWARESPGSVRALELRNKTLVALGRYDEAATLLRSDAEANPKMRKLALHLVIIDCYRGKLDQEVIEHAAAQMRSIPFNRSSLEAISMLRRHAESGRCGPALSTAAWQSLIEAMLANPSFARNAQSAAYLWVEKASSRVQQRDLPGAITALEAAYQARQDPRLAAQAAQLMLNHGLCGRAEQWNRRSERSLPRTFDGWMVRLSRDPSAEAVYGKIRDCNTARDAAIGKLKAGAPGRGNASLSAAQ